eukprot:Nk52_evm54s745 gene=Nk52_evmTU54s745
MEIFGKQGLVSWLVPWFVSAFVNIFTFVVSVAVGGISIVFLPGCEKTVFEDDIAKEKTKGKNSSDDKVEEKTIEEVPTAVADTEEAATTQTAETEEEDPDTRVLKRLTCHDGRCYISRAERGCVKLHNHFFVENGRPMIHLHT